MSAGVDGLSAAGSARWSAPVAAGARGAHAGESADAATRSARAYFTTMRRVYPRRTQRAFEPRSAVSDGDRSGPLFGRGSFDALRVRRYLQGPALRAWLPRIPSSE